MALGMAASHGTVLPSPLVIAGVAIIEADWHKVVMIGAPVAVLSAVVGWAFAAIAGHRVPLGGLDMPLVSGPASSLRGVLALGLTTALLLVMLGIQSLGDMPTEPFGGGPAREWLLGLGRPFIILIVGTSVMACAAGGWNRRLWSEHGAVASAIARCAPVLLLIGAGGGLQVLAQDARIAELMAERVLDLHLGLFLPFLVALTMKAVQGSSLVAAITAAGMVQPLLAAIGLDTETGRALAVVAIGAGSMSASHLNDTLFWVVTGSLGLSPLRGVGLLTVGTLLQGTAAIAALTALEAVIP
jgi:GntP family gluconate:H+ symporter